MNKSLAADLAEFQSFKDRVNIIFVVDHAGRSGNVFFQTIFDQHPGIIACPVMNYLYSYMLTQLGEHDFFESKVAGNVCSQNTYFSTVYSDLTEGVRSSIRRFGGDPDAPLDRERVRHAFDGLLSNKNQISRKELLLSMYFSLAKGLGRDVGGIKYIMCPDSISLRYETAIDGFSGKIIDFVLQDFPNAKLIHLVRDPRAGLASSVHQFINQLGNIYGLKLGNFWNRFLRLARRDFDWDSVFVFGFWLIYFRQTYEAIMRKREQYPNHFMTVRNEDLNLKFRETMCHLAKTLDFQMLETWSNGFQPTLLGLPWGGVGAYNNNTQKNQQGPLANDSDDVSRRATGPNEYVTKRWRTRMKAHEIEIVERLLASEMKVFGYEPVNPVLCGSASHPLWVLFALPLSGELPSLSWILGGRHQSVMEVCHRLFYSLVFPIFFVASRLSFLSFMKQGRVFK